jgi:ABC-type antimicrobial peptide transport system permease subunit
MTHDLIDDLLWLCIIMGFIGGVVGSALFMLLVSYLFKKEKK